MGSMCDGIRQLRDLDDLRLCVVGPERHHRPVAHVARDDLERPVAVQIDEPDVGNRRGGRGLRRRDETLAEDDLPVERRPLLRRRQLLRARATRRSGRWPASRAAGGPSARPCRRPGRLGLVVLDEQHPRDLVAPDGAREHIGRGHLVTGRRTGCGRRPRPGQGPPRPPASARPPRASEWRRPATTAGRFPGTRPGRRRSRRAEERGGGRSQSWTGVRMCAEVATWARKRGQSPFRHGDCPRLSPSRFWPRSSASSCGRRRPSGAPRI